MSGPTRRFDPSELHGPGEPAAVARGAGRRHARGRANSRRLAAGPSSVRPKGFEDRVMAAIALEPVPKLVVRPGSAVRGGIVGVVPVDRPGCVARRHDRWPAHGRPCPGARAGPARGRGDHGRGRRRGRRCRAACSIAGARRRPSSRVRATHRRHQGHGPRPSRPRATASSHPRRRERRSPPSRPNPVTRTRRPRPPTTAEPTETADADETDHAETPRPRRTPRPTETPEPAETPKAGETPKASDDHSGSGGRLRRLTRADRWRVRCTVIVVIGSPSGGSRRRCPCRRGRGDRRDRRRGPRCGRSSSSAGSATTPRRTPSSSDLAGHGVGHVAVLRDAAHPTPIDGGRCPTRGETGLDLEPEDVELALRYLTDFAVVAVVDAAGYVLSVVERAATWGAATLIVVVGAPRHGLRAEPGRRRPAGTDGGETSDAFAARVGEHLAAPRRGGGSVRSAR